MSSITRKSEVGERVAALLSTTAARASKVPASERQLDSDLTRTVIGVLVADHVVRKGAANEVEVEQLRSLASQLPDHPSRRGLGGLVPLPARPSVGALLLRVAETFGGERQFFAAHPPARRPLDDPRRVLEQYCDDAQVPEQLRSWTGELGRDAPTTLTPARGARRVSRPGSVAGTGSQPPSRRKAGRLLGEIVEGATEGIIDGLTGGGSGRGGGGGGFFDL